MHALGHGIRRRRMQRSTGGNRDKFGAHAIGAKSKGLHADRSVFRARQHGSTGAVAEENTRVAIRVIHNAGERLGANDQDIFVGPVL
jgi:hypothetical protein